MKNLIKTIVAATVLFTFMGQAHAGESLKQYNNPKLGGDRIDWCLSWGQGCGKPAADVFCERKGYKKAKNFSIAQNIGLSIPTRVISTGAVCDQGFCDGFKRITCSKPAPTTKYFFKPKHMGKRLDWCAGWANGCGKPAAQKFCEIKGYGQVVRFSKATDIGLNTPTRVISTGAVCDQGFCDGFKAIKCQK